jgi:hypothetical protein
MGEFGRQKVKVKIIFHNHHGDFLRGFLLLKKKSEMFFSYFQTLNLATHTGSICFASFLNFA